MKLILLFLILSTCFCKNGNFNVFFDSFVDEQAKFSLMLGVNTVYKYINLNVNISVYFRNTTLDNGVLATTVKPDYCYDLNEKYQLLQSALYLQRYGSTYSCNGINRYNINIFLSQEVNYYYRNSNRVIEEDQYDLATLSAHEVCHGLGIDSLLNEDGTFRMFDSPTAYDAIILNLKDNKRVSSSLTDNSLFFPFPKLKYPLYSRNPFWNGTSLVHGFYGLMNYKGFKGLEACEMDIYTLSILQRLGYPIRNCDNPDFSNICGYCNSGVQCVISESSRNGWILNFLLNE